MSKLDNLTLEKIRLDGGTQPRTEIDETLALEYSEQLASLPPVVVFFDGTTYWLADGFHRARAHIIKAIKYIMCDVHEGSQRDAILFSLSANAGHGKRRDPADKERAVRTMLLDDEWRTWTQAKIADTCKVSTWLVSKVMSQIRDESKVSSGKSASVSRLTDTKRVVKRGDKEYKIETAVLSAKNDESDQDEISQCVQAILQSTERLRELCPKHPMLKYLSRAVEAA